MKKYVRPEVDIIEFGKVDILMTSREVTPTPMEQADQENQDDQMEPMENSKVPINNSEVETIFDSFEPPSLPGTGGTGPNDIVGENNHDSVDVTEGPLIVLPPDDGNTQDTFDPEPAPEPEPEPEPVFEPEVVPEADVVSE